MIIGDRIGRFNPVRSWGLLYIPLVGCKLVDGTLKQSTAYTYTFVLGLTEVKVEASVVQDGWVNGTGGDVAVPKTN